MTTKEQERKALAQIRKIVESLGENSYLATAFAGCFEDAEDNIENDFAFSWKARAETAGQQINGLMKENKKLTALLDDYKQQIKGAAKTIAEQQGLIRGLEQSRLSDDDIEDLKQLLDNEIYTAEQSMEQSAKTIVELAETPNDIGFAAAVKSNRAAKRKVTYCNELKARLERTK